MEGCISAFAKNTNPRECTTHLFYQIEAAVIRFWTFQVTMVPATTQKFSRACASIVDLQKNPRSLLSDWYLEPRIVPRFCNDLTPLAFRFPLPHVDDDSRHKVLLGVFWFLRSFFHPCFQNHVNCSGNSSSLILYSSPRIAWGMIKDVLLNSRRGKCTLQRYWAIDVKRGVGRFQGLPTLFNVDELQR